MELYQLRTFVRIADEGSLTRAAEALYTSQPAISAQVKALEEELGVRLFDRNARGMTLTAKGKMLYARAVATLDAAAGLKAQALQLQQALVGELRIGVHTDFGFLRIGDLHMRLQQRHPRLQLHFMQGMTAYILPDIQRGRLDGGFFFGACQDAELATVQLAEVPMRVVGPWAWRDRIAGAALEELAAMPWVYTSTSCPFHGLAATLLAPVADSPESVAFADNEDAVRELVCAGAGLSMLRADDAAALESAGRAACWHGDTPSIGLYFAVQCQRVGEPAVDALRDTVTEIWPAGRAEDERLGA
jgi:DNA-binding transcriptional LysR family regulator